MITSYNKQELKVLKEVYFTAKALFETIRDTAEEIQKNILVEHPFFEEAEKTAMFESKGRGNRDTRILKPFDSYLMSEADFNKYLDLCYAEYQKAGIDDKRGREYLPEAESRELYKESERLLVEYGIDIIPDGMAEKEALRTGIKITKYRNRVLELVLNRNGRNAVCKGSPPCTDEIGEKG